MFSLIENMFGSIENKIIPVGFHFSVEFNVNDERFSDFRFQEVSGLSVSLSVEEFSEGGENRFKYQIPGKPQYANLTLKRGMLIGSELIAWCIDAIENYDFKPARIIVNLLNGQHDPLISWQVIGAYPIRWEVTSLNAEKNELVIETIEMVYQHFSLLK